MFGVDCGVDGFIKKWGQVALSDVDSDHPHAVAASETVFEKTLLPNRFIVTDLDFDDVFLSSQTINLPAVVPDGDCAKPFALKLSATPKPESAVTDI